MRHVRTGNPSSLLAARGLSPAASGPNAPTPHLPTYPPARNRTPHAPRAASPPVLILSGPSREGDMLARADMPESSLPPLVLPASLSSARRRAAEPNRMGQRRNGVATGPATPHIPVPSPGDAFTVHYGARPPTSHGTPCCHPPSPSSPTRPSFSHTMQTGPTPALTLFPLPEPCGTFPTLRQRHRLRPRPVRRAARPGCRPVALFNRRQKGAVSGRGRTAHGGQAAAAARARIAAPVRRVAGAGPRAARRRQVGHKGAAAGAPLAASAAAVTLPQPGCAVVTGARPRLATHTAPVSDGCGAAAGPAAAACKHRRARRRCGQYARRQHGCCHGAVGLAAAGARASIGAVEHAARQARRGGRVGWRQFAVCERKPRADGWQRGRVVAAAAPRHAAALGVRLVAVKFGQRGCGLACVGCVVAWWFARVACLCGSRRCLCRSGASGSPIRCKARSSTSARRRVLILTRTRVAFQQLPAPAAKRQLRHTHERAAAATAPGRRRRCVHGRRRRRHHGRVRGAAVRHAASRRRS